MPATVVGPPMNANERKYGKLRLLNLQLPECQSMNNYSLALFHRLHLR